MSLSDVWKWYVDNRVELKPLLAPLGSVIVGLGTVLVGGLVAWAALRQARTATRVAHSANLQAKIAAARHEEQTRTDRQRRITDTFSKAVEQLASEKVEVCVGGIYTLERLAGESVSWSAADGKSDQGANTVSELYWTVMETLTAFARERARWEAPPAPALEMTAGSDHSDARSDDALTPPRLATHIAAVMQVIRRRPDVGREHEKKNGWQFDLNRTDFRGAFLEGMHLEDVNLREAHLERASLKGAHLQDANLGGAYLGRTNLSEAHLKRANLSRAHLEHAYLRGANLERADLFLATMIGANLNGADLTGANLSRADLNGVNLTGANLSGTKLTDANLSGADLIDANLSRADLIDANLSRADLRRANLSAACLSDANLSGADLTDAYSLTQPQLDKACGAPRALPAGLTLDWPCPDTPVAPPLNPR